jgi:hypothetical protein
MTVQPSSPAPWEASCPAARPRTVPAASSGRVEVGNDSTSTASISSLSFFIVRHPVFMVEAREPTVGLAPKIDPRPTGFCNGAEGSIILMVADYEHKIDEHRFRMCPLPSLTNQAPAPLRTRNNKRVMVNAGTTFDLPHDLHIGRKRDGRQTRNGRGEVLAASALWLFLLVEQPLKQQSLKRRLPVPAGKDHERCLASG